ncbi:hypothetical protein ACROYT_G040640 [Oculina patagonica]
MCILYWSKELLTKLDTHKSPVAIDVQSSVVFELAEKYGWEAVDCYVQEPLPCDSDEEKRIQWAVKESKVLKAESRKPLKPKAQLLGRSQQSFTLNPNSLGMRHVVLPTLRQKFESSKSDRCFSLRKSQSFCKEMPRSDPLYLVHLLQITTSLASIQAAAFRVAWAHQKACLPSPVQHTMVRQLLEASKANVVSTVLVRGSIHCSSCYHPSNPLPCTITSEGDAGDVLKDFADIFQGVGKFKDFQLKLHINKNVKPVAQPVRRLPFGLRGKVDKKLDELLQEDIIEEVPCGPTEWTSPLVVVPKQDGDIRICVDMRRAHEAMERERYPIPTIEEVLHDLNGSTVFSKLDLRRGFHPIKLNEKSRQITMFVTHRGLYRYKRLMFGITSAPEKYQKIVSDVLQGQCGRTLNASKCHFRLPKLTFFGHDLSKNGVTPSEEKVTAVQNVKPPKNVAEVRSFLGLVQYCAKFLPNFAQEAEPIRQLTRKDKPFIWEEAHQQCRSYWNWSSSHTISRWRLESDLLCIRESNPHSTTGMTPASLMFGREMKTKLPKLRLNKSVLDESIRDRDWNHKLSSKLYADKKRNATFNTVLPGDKVLLTNTKSSGKLAPHFEPQPYTVQTKEGHKLP